MVRSLFDLFLTLSHSLSLSCTAFAISTFLIDWLGASKELYIHHKQLFSDFLSFSPSLSIYGAFFLSLFVTLFLSRAPPSPPSS